MLAWNCLHMLKQKVCSENRVLLYAWKNSGWVLAMANLVFFCKYFRNCISQYVCFSRLNSMQEKSVCQQLVPVMSQVWWSSFSGSSQSPFCPQSCRMPFSRSSSCPLRRRELLPPCCCLVCCQTKTLVYCVTFLTSFTVYPRGIVTSYSWSLFI